MIKVLDKRFKTFGLKLNLSKTMIVYCKDDDRKGDYENISFDFLGYTFKPIKSKSKYGRYFTSFLPAMSNKAEKAVRKEVISLEITIKSRQNFKRHSKHIQQQNTRLDNYYSHYYKSKVTNA